MSKALHRTAVGHGSGEPYRLPAGLLAVAVHCAFFAFLYFGFSWRTEPAATMSVELWDSLPRVAQPVAPKVEPQPEEQEPVRKEAVAKEPEPAPKAESRAAKAPEIAVPDKKAKPVEKQTVAKPAPRLPTPEELLAARERAEQAERDAAAGRVVDEYVAKIQGKIRSKIVMPPDVPDDAAAVFLVTVLPGGSVLNPRLQKSSGNAAWDSAVERAILKAQPLPLPQDATLFNRFRELRLTFRPKEQ